MSEGGHRTPVLGDSAQRRDAILYFLAFLAIGLVIAYLNRGHVEQQSNYWGEYVPMADYYRGLVTRSVLTYPMWGYSLVLLALPRYELVAIPQVVLGSAAATLLFIALRRELPEHRKAITILFVAAVPWYALHSVKWPQSFAASFCLIGLLVLTRAVAPGRLALGAAAGVSFGAALYFRSEFLYLPLFVVCVAIVSRVTRGYRRFALRPAVAAAVVAWAALVPWAIHYHRLTGRYSLTASQRGIVSFTSLGQLPGNPWGATYLDEYAYDYLKRQQIDVIPQSDSGDRVLYAEFKRRVREHPGAFAAKAVWNAGMTLASGFYNVEIPLTADDDAKLVALRSGLRSALARSDNDAKDPALRPGPRVYGAFVYWVVSKLLGAIFVTVAMAGLLLAAWRGIQSPLLLTLASYVVYQFLLLLVLATEPRYLNGLYPALVPFFILAYSGATDVWRAWRMSRTRVVPALVA